jgi:diamine N-acetyltransferase
MIIRKIIQYDLIRLVNFAKKTFISAFAHLNNPFDFEAYINEAFTIVKYQREFDTEGSVFYFLEEDDTILGYLKLNIHKSPRDIHKPHIYQKQRFFKEKMLEIERIYVDTTAQSKGLGLKLVEHTEQIAHQNNCTYIWLGVWDRNPNAIRFYERCGFKPFGEHVFTIGTDDQTDILMLKRLS